MSKPSNRRYPAGVGVEVAKFVEHLAGVAIRLQELPGGGILPDCANQPLELG
jgi:hypothetical protein